MIATDIIMLLTPPWKIHGVGLLLWPEMRILMWIGLISPLPSLIPKFYRRNTAKRLETVPCICLMKVLPLKRSEMLLHSLPMMTAALGLVSALLVLAGLPTGNGL